MPLMRHEQQSAHLSPCEMFAPPFPAITPIGRCRSFGEMSRRKSTPWRDPSLRHVTAALRCREGVVAGRRAPRASSWDLGQLRACWRLPPAPRPSVAAHCASVRSTGLAPSRANVARGFGSTYPRTVYLRRRKYSE
jgi:hypothetical protein